jgi:hypothetical protein
MRVRIALLVKKGRKGFFQPVIQCLPILKEPLSRSAEVHVLLAAVATAGVVTTSQNPENSHTLKLSCYKKAPGCVGAFLLSFN